jgi:hypothetical protein
MKQPEKLEFDLAQAAGVDASKMSFTEVYELGGRIIADEWLRRRMVSYGFKTEVVYGHEVQVPRFDREEILGFMPEEEKAALRERVWRKPAAEKLSRTLGRGYRSK